MSDKKAISHEGFIVRVGDDGTADVSITSVSACAGCNARAACGMGESSEKIITVKTKKSLKAGDKVIVTMEQSMGTKAVIIAYAIPFIVLIATFIIATLVGANELISALVTFASLGLYYVIVWLFREKINKKFEFKIKD